MAQSNKVTDSFLQSFVDAFNAHDLNAIMSHMTEDCIFPASAGPYADGEKFVGQLKVRQAFEEVFKPSPMLAGAIPGISFQETQGLRNGSLQEPG